MKLVGSLVVHAVIGVVLFAVAQHPAPAQRPAAASIEVISAPAEVTTIDVTATPPIGVKGSEPGGSPGGSSASASVTASAASAPPLAPARALVASRAPTRAARRTAEPTTAGEDVFDDPRGEITFESVADPSGEASSASDLRGGSASGSLSAGSASGKGTGTGGTGTGIGFGDGGGVTAGPPPPPPPPAPKLSKARPARLIFPTRQRDVDDGELYVMRVTVDADGFVAGATLVRGFGGRRDEVASAQIWRFRYDPARDDDGRPVRSVLEQRFLVQ